MTNPVTHFPQNGSLRGATRLLIPNGLEIPAGQGGKRDKSGDRADTGTGKGDKAEWEEEPGPGQALSAPASPGPAPRSPARP